MKGYIILEKYGEKKLDQQEQEEQRSDDEEKKEEKDSPLKKYLKALNIEILKKIRPVPSNLTPIETALSIL